MKKRGQLTIFIIVGVIIIAGVSLFYLISSGKIAKIGGQPGTENMDGFLASCMKDNVIQGVTELSLQGGSLNNPLSTSFKFNDATDPINISYLCYTDADSKPCTNQQPLLFSYFEDNLKQYSQQTVKNCFDSLVSNLGGQGNNVSSSYNDFNVSIKPNLVIININAILTTAKTETQRYDSFQVEIPSNIDETLRVVQDIINTEATSCSYTNFNSLNYPDYDINWYSSLNSSTIYSVRNRQTSDQFNLAVRGCVTPLIS